MAESSQGRQKEVIAYLSAQIDKINITLQQHTLGLQSISLLETKVERQNRHHIQLEKHLKVLEVYQSQNFSNNQRLFNAQAHVEMLQNRIFVLEELTQGTQPPQYANEIHKELFKVLEARLAELEDEMNRFREKNQVLSTFRRDLSPGHCESTKDVSAQGNRQQLKRMQRRLKQFVIQKMSEFEKCIKDVNKTPTAKFDQDYQTNIQLRASRHTKVRQLSSKEQNNSVKNRISDYYQQTEKKQYGIHKVKEKNKKQKEKSQRKRQKRSKTKHKSGSKSLGSKSKREKSNEGLNLVSVNEYLRLRQYRHG